MADLTDGGDKQFTATLTLTGGDATDDNLIDILDFGVFAGQYGQPSHATGRDADFSCNDTIWTEDFTFIQLNFLSSGDSQPGQALAEASLPRTSVSVREFSRIVGRAYAGRADINRDGVISLQDVRLFMLKMRRR